MSGVEVSIPWSDKLQEAMTAISRMDEATRNANPHLLVARHLLVLLKLGESRTPAAIVWYTKHKESAARSFTDDVLLSAVVQVVEKLRSPRPMDVMNL